MNKNIKFFDAYGTDSVGVWYFVPQSGAYKNGVPCKGFGCIKYAEGSVYAGDLFYDGKAFNKLGCGKQDFTHSDIGRLLPSINQKIYKFVGRYDYRKTDWIYGNGVLYYTDASGKPSHFCKGFFAGLDKTGEYKGEFDCSTLIDGYTPDMEFDFDAHADGIETRWRAIRRALDGATEASTVFLGDSYFELFDRSEFAGKNLFADIFPSEYLNIGIGGSKFADWIGWIDRLDGVAPPARLIVNLGFNDIHSGRGVKNTYSDLIKLLKLLRARFPHTRFYLISVVHSPSAARWINEEREYNSKIAQKATDLGVTVGEWNSRIAKSGKNCFHADELHPDEYGYGLFADFLKEFLA